MRTSGELQPSQGAQTAPHSRGLGGWLGWSREFVARQPVAAFRSPVVCGTLTLASRFLTFLAYLASPTHPGRSLTLAALHSPRVPSLTNPSVFTPLILNPAPKLPGCKRLHLSFGPSWAARSSGWAKNQILSGVRCRGCVRRASSSRPRAHRRRPRPVVWVVGRARQGPAVSPAHCDFFAACCDEPCTSASSAVRSRWLPGYSRSLLISRSPLTPGAPQCPAASACI